MNDRKPLTTPDLAAMNRVTLVLWLIVWDAVGDLFDWRRWK